jgi:hypothetical protein
MALPEGFVLEKLQGQINLPSGFTLEETPKNTTYIAPDVPLLASQRPKLTPIEEPKTSMMDKLKALYEVPTAIVHGAIKEPLSMAYGLGASAVEGAMQGKMPTPESRDAYYKQAKEFAPYIPSSPASMSALESIGGALQEARIPPYIGNIGAIPSFAQTAQVSKPAIQEAVQTAKPTLANALRGKVTVESAPTMAGVGAAQVPEAVNRVQMAQQLRVPIKLSKGEATRDLAQQQFEAETMKTYPGDVGRPLIAEKELKNTQIGQNLDAYVDATGAKVANEFYMRPTGEAVDTALRESADSLRKSYKKAYETARASEEGQQIVNVKSITDQLDNMEAEALNAPVINSARLKLQQLAPNGEITLNNLEEVRKMVGALSQDTPTQMKFGGDIKSMIDVATKDAGGDLFKEARKLRTKFANQFENVGLIDDLLKTKPKSNDRVVALEKVFDHSIMQSDLDSLMSLGKVLKKTEKGQQAWKELQGQGIESLRSAITKNIETDSLGQRTFNPKQFDVIIKNLDKSGKLDYLYGKSGAQEIRNLRDTVITINSPVKGINTSNTASAMDKVLNGILRKTVGKIPFGGAMVEAGVEAVEKKNIAKKVKESLEYNPMADALRNTK